MTMKKYREIRLKTLVDAGDLFGLLEESGCIGAGEIDGQACFYWPESRWNPDTIYHLKEALERLGDAKALEGASFEEVPDVDWNRQWIESLKPVRIGRRLRVRQSWNEAEAACGMVELIIDPKRAFGSGYHATTQLIAGWLEDVIRGGERVLDIGTGSGILAMAALRLGAASALAIDSDPEAVECARENAAANGFGAELELIEATPDMLAGRRFPLAVANLDRNTLLRVREVLHRCLEPGGRLIASGLLRQDCEEFTELMIASGWRIGRCRELEGWLAMELLEPGPAIGEAEAGGATKSASESEIHREENP
jgi:ribosomal protein L11 methyltransferase